MTLRHLSFICFVLSLCSTVQGMIFDNPHERLPFYYKPWLRWPCTSGHVRIQPFFMRADRANGEDEESIGWPELDGRYDQVSIAQSLLASKRISEDPFRSDFRGFSTIPWRREGRLDAEGIAFFYEQYLTCLPYIGCDLSIGGSMLFVHLNSRNEFFLEAECFPSMSFGDRKYLYLLKEKMNKELGVIPPLYSKTAVGDGEYYLRFGKTWDYTYKFRHIDAAFKLGLLAPIAPKVPINNPAAIPIGYNKHWGLYVGYEGDFEVKEDMRAGILLRAIKRLPKTDLLRLPAGFEPNGYGAAIGQFRVNPGFTLVAAPQVTLEALRGGLGVSLIYTLIGHFKDRITDQRCEPTTPVNIPLAQERSKWADEHFTLWGFYDFAKYRDSRGLLPTVSLLWDMPTQWLVSKRSSKTHNVSLLVELDF